MAVRTVLHVGAMKSATTHLQGTCDANTDALAAAGYQWLGAERNFAAVHDLLDGDGTGQWRRLRRAIAQHPGTALVSNELISIRGPAASAKLARRLGTPVEVIVTARDLARVIPSQWKTGHENHRPTPWDEFIAALVGDDREHEAVRWFWRRQDIRRIVEKWSPLADSVTLVTVPPAGSAGDEITRRFATALGLDLSVLAKPSLRVPIRRRVPYPELTDAERGWAQERSALIAKELGELDIPVIGSLSDLVSRP